jgi:hypothetical protein
MRVVTMRVEVEAGEGHIEAALAGLVRARIAANGAAIA